MPKLEITEKRNCLSHAHVAIGLEANISYWFSRIDYTHNVLCDYIQSWRLSREQHIRMNSCSNFSKVRNILKYQLITNVFLHHVHCVCFGLRCIRFCGNSNQCNLKAYMITLDAYKKVKVLN